MPNPTTSSESAPTAAGALVPAASSGLAASSTPTDPTARSRMLTSRMSLRPRSAYPGPCLVLLKTASSPDSTFITARPTSTPTASVTLLFHCCNRDRFYYHQRVGSIHFRALNCLSIDRRWLHVGETHWSGSEQLLDRGPESVHFLQDIHVGADDNRRGRNQCSPRQPNRCRQYVPFSSIPWRLILAREMARNE